MADATIEIQGADGFSDDVKLAIAKWAEAVSLTTKLLHSGENENLSDEETGALYEMPITAAAAIHAPAIVMTADQSVNEALPSIVALIGMFAERIATQTHNFAESRAANQQKH